MKKNLDAIVVKKTNSTLKPKTSKKSPTYRISPGDELQDSIELKRNYDITPNPEFLKAQRHLGHDNFTAPKDVIDNALDPDVNAKNVWVDISQSDGKYTSVRIADDGLGISPLIIDEVLKYGSKTGRDKSKFLGGYGSGLNTAALALGTKFEIRTKSENGAFYIREFDYYKILETDKLEAPGRIGTNKEYNEFMKVTQSITGTIVTITELDRMKNKDITSYIEALNRSLGKAYFYFITKFDKHIFLNGKEVVPIDPISRHLPEIVPYAINQKFEYNGHKFTFSVYNIPHLISRRRTKEAGRNKTNAGMYIFRNKRLVGEALDLGIVGLAADGHLSGIRIEFFMDGDCDELFDLTYIKVIRELNKEQIDQDFRDACKSAIGKYVREIRNDDDLGDKARREKRNSTKSTNLNKEKIKNKQKKEKIKNKYLKIGSNAYVVKKRPLDLTIRVEESISSLYAKNPQGYAAALEKLIRELTCLYLSSPKNNAGDAFVNSKSIKFSLSGNTYIVTRYKNIIEIKVSYCDTNTNTTFAIVRIKPTQKINYYIILLVDIIIPDGEVKPSDFIGYFYCLPASYIEKSEDFKRDTVCGTEEANKNNQDCEKRFTINKQEAFEKFGAYNLLRGTSFTDLLEYLDYLNNDEITSELIEVK